MTKQVLSFFVLAICLTVSVAGAEEKTRTVTSISVPPTHTATKLMVGYVLAEYIFNIGAYLLSSTNQLYTGFDCWCVYSKDGIFMNGTTLTNVGNFDGAVCSFMGHQGQFTCVERK